MAKPPEADDLFEAFKFCVRRSDTSAIQCLQAIREHGFALSALRDNSGNTLLHFAASRGCRFAAELLLRGGLRPKDLNSGAKSPFAIAEDFRGYGKPYKLTYEHLQLYEKTTNGVDDHEDVVKRIASFEEPPPLPQNLLSMIGARLLYELPAGATIEAVVQCLEKPMDPQSLLMVVSDSGKTLKMDQESVNRQMQKLVKIQLPARKAAAAPKSRAKRPAPEHAQVAKKPKQASAENNNNSAHSSEPLKLCSKTIGTARDCAELRLRLQTAESRLLHSARVNAMLTQALAVANGSSSTRRTEAALEPAKPAVKPVDEKAKIKGGGKEQRRLKTNNTNIGRILHWAEAVHPAEWKMVNGFMLFQRILTRHRTASGKTLLEAMHEDLSDVQDVVNGRYSRYVVQQANQSSQCRCPSEIKRASITTMPEWTQCLEKVIREAVFPYLQPMLDLREDQEEAVRRSSQYASKLKGGHSVDHPEHPSIGGHPILGGGEPVPYHHMVVSYSANLEPHFDPPYLGHAADLVLSNPEGGYPKLRLTDTQLTAWLHRPSETHRIHLEPGDIYVLLGDARYKWIHEIQLTDQAVRTSVVSRYWLKGHEFKEWKWDQNKHSWWRDINGASAL